MPSLDITNPAVIIFLKENYEKENRLRLNWIHKHFKSIKEAATLHREPTNYFESDVIAHNMVEGMATITRDFVVAGYNRRKTPIRDGTLIPGVKNLRSGHSIVDIGLGNPKEDPRLARAPTDLSPDPVMRPIDPKIKEIFYKSRPYFGRQEYLNKRSKVWPENRYYFPETSYWDYGWRIRDSGLRQKPSFGRCWRLTKTMQSRVGPQPDPWHYKSSDQPGLSKCVAM